MPSRNSCETARNARRSSPLIGASLGCPAAIARTASPATVLSRPGGLFWIPIAEQAPDLPCSSPDHARRYAEIQRHKRYKNTHSYKSFGCCRHIALSASETTLTSSKVLSTKNARNPNYDAGRRSDARAAPDGER